MPVAYRADHVGSFLRPRAILDARKDPRVTPGALREIEDAEILKLLERQRALGFRILTDGELRRHGFMSDFYDSVDGLDNDGSVAREWKGQSVSTGGTTANQVRLAGLVVGKLTQKKRLTDHESRFLTRHAHGDVKMTLPSANQFPAIAYQKGLSERAYPTYSAFLWDVVPIIRSEVQALIGDGVKYIQIDAPRYSYYLDPKWREYLRTEMGVSPEAALDEAIRVDNACVEAARGAGAVVAIHLCRGNNRSQWYAEGGYDPIAEKLFNELNVDLFLLEYETERAGTLRAAPFRAQGQGSRARVDQQQGRQSRAQGADHPAHRGCESIRPSGQPGPQPAMRVRVHLRRQPPHRGRAVAQDAARRRRRAPDLGTGLD